MCERDYQFEDFVLDPDFQKWVLSPTAATKAYWEDYLEKNPGKYAEMALARKMVLNISRKSHPVGERLASNWQRIENTVSKMEMHHPEEKVVPMDALSSLHRHRRAYPVYHRSHQWYRLVGILVTVFALALTVNLLLPPKPSQQAEVPIVYEEHYAPPGVKSNLTLQDGSKVILNSGSTLRYVKNFESHRRVLELEGEGYFEVEKDPHRPFMVKTGPVTTTALGTSFNIKAYKNEPLDIFLLTGLVSVQVEMEESQSVNLEKGEALQVNWDTKAVRKSRFDEKKLMAWTHKTIVFDHTPMAEVTRVLENWYGVKVHYKNQPQEDLELSGWFHDQTLRNVLEGLSYSARFDFEIDKDQVTITFK
ncbi:FecR family protein [Negadavirga shengliensis]|uniref:FecR family protein n=1 Tax=Negadavirga shengliensis TaxID=1389218 RepID=A0ABV9SZM6_9BACT